MPRIDDVAVLFTSCMKDPARPKGCARMLCGCLHLLDGQSEDSRFALLERYDMPDGEHYEYIRKTYPAYLSACATFLSSTHSSQDEEQLEASLRTCTCSRNRNHSQGLLHWLHTFEVAHQFALDDFIQSLIRHLAGILQNAVETKTVGGVSAIRGLKRHRKSTGNTLWPVDATQLIPRGLEQSMKGYAEAFRWCPLDRFQDGLLLVDSILAICGRSIIPHLFQFLPAFPLRITALSNALCREREATVGAPVSYDVEQSWICTLAIIVDFCQRLLTGEWNPSDISLFVRVAAPYNGTNRSLGLLFVCDTILNHLPLFREGTTHFTNENYNTLVMTVARFGAIFYGHNSPEDTTVYHDAILLMHEDFKAATVKGTPDAIWQDLVGVSNIRRCCAPECSETFVSAQRTFARCAGCGVPRYCSRECQKRAWKHTSLPHKDVCAKLRLLSERTNLPKDRVLAETGRQTFVSACRADDELMASVQECRRHLVDMLKAREESVPEAFEALQAKLAARADPVTK